MIVKCEKSGTREKCKSCEHAAPHKLKVGCGGGQCYPPIIGKDVNGVEGPIIQIYDCVEIKEVDI